MNTLKDDDVRAVVEATLAERDRLYREDIDAAVMKSIVAVLTTFGIDDDDRRELRADFQHLRRWRKSVEQAQSFTFKAVISVIVAGLLGAIWLGVKAMLGK